MTNDPIRKLAETIWEEPAANEVSLAHVRKHLDALLALSREDRKAFIAFNLLNYPAVYAHRLMIGAAPVWESFSVTDWQDVFRRLHASEAALRSLIPFLGKFLGLSGMRLYSGLTDVDENVRGAVRRFFGDDPPFRLTKVDQKELELLEVQAEAFAPVRKRLIADGAPAIGG